MSYSDDLKNIYKGAGALDRYFDGRTPVDLFRGQKIGAQGDFMLPTIIGWYSKLGKPRRPDILINDQNKNTPQYVDIETGQLALEGKELELTAEILRNADQYIVKGCRTMFGHHRGVSVFDKKNPRLKFDWYILLANSKIPEALALTRDDVQSSKPDPIHYTIAPKDDMPLSLFLQYLKGMGSQATLSKIDLRLNMSDISAETLSLAIFSIIINRCRLLDRVERVSLEVDNEEHLSESVLDLDKALGELGTAYEKIRLIEGGWYDYRTLYANALEEYKKDCQERQELGRKLDGSEIA